MHWQPNGVGRCAPRRCGSALAAGGAPVDDWRVVAPGVVHPRSPVPFEDRLHLIRGGTIGMLGNQAGVGEHGEFEIERVRSERACVAEIRLAASIFPARGIADAEDGTNLACGIVERSRCIPGPPDSLVTLAPAAGAPLGWWWAFGRSGRDRYHAEVAAERRRRVAPFLLHR